jgi:hypothetical protein
VLSPTDIKKKIVRYWPKVIHSEVRGESIFPLNISLGMPTSRDLLGQFVEIDAWARHVRRFCSDHRLTCHEADINHRQLGLQKIPKTVSVDRLDLYLDFTKKTALFGQIKSAFDETMTVFPHLGPWLNDQFLFVERHVAVWSRFLRVAEYFRKFPDSQIYMRELDIPQVDTKFIESHRTALSRFLEVALPETSDKSIGAPTTLAEFCRKYGLKHPQATVKFRWLDRDLSPLTMGMTTLEVPLDEFATLNPPVDMVFITENKINGLSFPTTPKAMIVFGLGYGIESLSAVPWLKHRRIKYWGDIDTHGYSILSRLRRHFPHIESFLMDEETLTSHRLLWTREETPATHQIDFEHLNPSESALCHKLQDNSFGSCVRLEQERVRIGWVRERI